MGFPGQVTFAVKANPSEEVLANLSAAGLTAFDVASSNEIELVRRIAPHADLHFNNPVRSPAEIAFAVGHDVASYSVDSDSELEKLTAQVSRDKEIAVRFKLPVNGAAYDFGAKFGAEPKHAAGLLRRVADAGYRPSLTFHPGTQCPDAAAWSKYIRAAGEIASDANVRICRLNTGGGFPSHRMLDEVPALDAIFTAIETAAAEAFGQERLALLCEPGRGIAAECLTLAVRVKATRAPGTIFVNDGVYGALSESLVMGATDRVIVVAPGGQARTGTKTAFRSLRANLRQHRPHTTGCYVARSDSRGGLCPVFRHGCLFSGAGNAIQWLWRSSDHFSAKPELSANAQIPCQDRSADWQMALRIP